jgi:hypothetical protein
MIRLVAAVLFLAMAQMACAGIVYEFEAVRYDRNFSFTLVLPDFFPGLPNDYTQYFPGVDNLTCNGCTSVWLGHYDGVSWDEDEVWFSDANSTNIFYFQWWALNILGTYYQPYDQATLRVYEGESQPNSGVPEPGTMALVLSGGIAALLWHRIRRAQS